MAVPTYMAKILTFPEHVFQHNLNYMRNLILNGPNKYPGANYVEYASDKSRTWLQYARREEVAKRL